MQKTALVLIASALALITLGCGLGFQSGSAGGYVLIPWRDASGNYPFQKVRLLSLESPKSLQSYRAKIFYGTGVESSGFAGSAVAPNVAQKGNLWLPLDAKSGLSITAFAIMERLYDFDRKMETLTALRWPRQVGIEIPVRTARGILTNNALYDLDRDVIAVTPYQNHETPVALNPGVLAHEHFHAHFAAAWKGGHAGSPFEINGTSAVASVNLAVISGWNEGLADFYAFVFTGDPDFLRASFSSGASDRRLVGEIQGLISWRGLFHAMGCEGVCRFEPKHLSYSYANGTSIARFLYEWGKAHEDGHPRLLNHIHRRLPVLMSRLRGEMATARISPALLLEDLAATSKLELTGRLCDQLASITGETSPKPIFEGCP